MSIRWHFQFNNDLIMQLVTQPLENQLVILKAIWSVLLLVKLTNILQCTQVLPRLPDKKVSMMLLNGLKLWLRPKSHMPESSTKLSTNSEPLNKLSTVSEKHDHHQKMLRSNLFRRHHQIIGVMINHVQSIRKMSTCSSPSATSHHHTGGA